MQLSTTVTTGLRFITQISAQAVLLDTGVLLTIEARPSGARLRNAKGIKVFLASEVFAEVDLDEEGQALLPVPGDVGGQVRLFIETSDQELTAAALLEIEDLSEVE